MEKSNDQPVDNKPRNWSPREVYREYAQFILDSDPQCWGKYNVAAKQKNYWIYKTIDVGHGKSRRQKIVEVMNYKRWKNIMQAYFRAAKDRIIYHGEGLSMGNLGMIQARRIERRHDKAAIDPHRTFNLQRGVERKDWKRHVYTDDDYIRIGWHKYQQYKNEREYEFIPTGGGTDRGDKTDGFRTEFSKANVADPTLKYKYNFHPICGITMYRALHPELQGPGLMVDKLDNQP